MKPEVRWKNEGRGRTEGKDYFIYNGKLANFIPMLDILSSKTLMKTSAKAGDSAQCVFPTAGTYCLAYCLRVIALLFKMVQMSDFRPSRGPVSGGSTVTVSGYHLDAGSETQLVLANETMNVVCDVISRSFYSVVCLTASVSQPFLADVLNLTVDNSVVILKGHTFSFAPDPVIESIFPERGIFRLVHALFLV